MSCCFSIDISPGLHSLLTHGYFHNSNIANRALVSTYISQVTENHPTSTGLSIANVGDREDGGELGNLKL